MSIVLNRLYSPAQNKKSLPQTCEIVRRVVGTFFELCASVGGGVVIGLMVFAFFNKYLAIAAGILVAFGSMPFTIGFLRDYAVLLSSLTAYGVSAIICTAMSLRSKERFNFATLAERVTSFQNAKIELTTAPASGTTFSKPAART